MTPVAHVEFTARIAERDLHLLKERSVMHYCVNLHGHTDKQFICGWNEILRDSTFDEDNQGWQTNPIWTNKHSRLPCRNLQMSKNRLFQKHLAVDSICSRTNVAENNLHHTKTSA